MNFWSNLILINEFVILRQKLNLHKDIYQFCTNQLITGVQLIYAWCLSEHAVWAFSSCLFLHVLISKKSDAVLLNFKNLPVKCQFAAGIPMLPQKDGKLRMLTWIYRLLTLNRITALEWRSCSPPTAKPGAWWETAGCLLIIELTVLIWLNISLWCGWILRFWFVFLILKSFQLTEYILCLF